MQSGLFIEVLVLQSERLMRVPIDAFVLFQTTPGGVFAVPQQITVDVDHLPRYADVVAVEVVGLLVAFSVFINEVSIGETACVRYTTCIFRLQLAVV